MSKDNELIAGLDIGTTKICMVIGQNSENGIDVVGVGTHPSVGLRKGMIINIEATVNSIMRACEEAELMAGNEIGSIYVGIAGNHVKSFNSQGVVAINGREVKEPDMARVIDAAQAVAIPQDREVLHVLPQEYMIDDQDGVKDPKGMMGVRLEAKVHMVTCSQTSAQNIVRCVNRSGLHVNDMILQQLASSSAVLNDDEKELGVCLVDIGGGTSDVIIYSEGNVKFTASLNIGGNNITNDIAVGLRTPIHEANKIKHKYGCALTSLVGKDEMIEVASVGGREPRMLSRKLLSEIIEPRMEEILSLIYREILKSGYEDVLTSGVVLTGGTAMMDGIADMATQVFETPVRVGYPQGIGGLTDLINNPMYSTAVGLVLFASTQTPELMQRTKDPIRIYDRFKTRMKEIFTEFF